MPEKKRPSDSDRMKAYEKQAAMKGLSKSQPRGDDGDDKVLDTEEVKNALRRAFRGYEIKTVAVETEEGVQTRQVKQWQVERPDEFEPICNEKALQDFFVPIEGIANVNTASANLTEKQIQDLGRGVMYGIIDLIAENHDEYDIDSMADANEIIGTISAVLMSSLSKSKDARMLEHREKSIQERILKTEEDDKSRRPSLTGRGG